MNNSKKKILYIITQAEWGGAQRYVFDLATNLATEFDITVATGQSDKDHQKLIEDIKDIRDIKILSFKHLVREINPFHDLLAIFEIAKFLRQNHFDVIHLNSSKAGVIGAMAAWTNQKYPIRQLADNIQYPKIIYTAHGWVFLEPLPWLRGLIYLWMEKIAAKLRHATIVLSEKEKEIAIKHGTTKYDTIYVIPNGIDLASTNFLPGEEARQALNSLNIKFVKNEILIGTIANLYKTKGLEFLIEAIKILSASWRTISNIQLVIIGDGPERKNLELRIMNHGLGDKIILTGAIPDAYKYLRAFDIFVLPSVKEGFPYTILEAMAAELPIVATRVGGIPEMIEDQKSGSVVPAAEPQKLAEAILDLINHPDKARELGQEAERRVKEKFALANTVEKTKMVYFNN